MLRLAFVVLLFLCGALVFHLVRKRVLRLNRSRFQSRACDRLSVQGKIFVMTVCDDCSAAARLYRHLLETASCPARVVIGVFQVTRHRGVLDLVEDKSDQLRVISSAHRVHTTEAVYQLMHRCHRTERTVCLLSPDTRAIEGWDEVLVGALRGRRVALGGKQGRRGEPQGFPCWTVRGGTFEVVERPFARPYTEGSTGYLETPRVVPAVAASSTFCAARADLFKKLRPVDHPNPDLALSAAIHAAGGKLAVLRDPPFYGGTRTSVQASQKSVQESVHKSSVRFGRRYGLDFSAVAVSGRAQLGLTPSADDNSEAYHKFGAQWKDLRATFQ